MRPIFFFISSAVACVVAFFALIFALLLTRAIVGTLLGAGHNSNRWCQVTHETNSFPIPSPKTAMDFFENGNYEYDRGNCQMAIVDYSQSIKLNPNYPEAYDNRAYTYMIMENYAMALPDLDKAIALRPDYVHALMNRGDIYNYYYNVDHQKALLDYNRVVAMGSSVYRSTPVCGHRIIAIDNGWNLKTVFDVFTNLPVLHRNLCTR